jgi:hypothetical protein
MNAPVFSLLMRGFLSSAPTTATTLFACILLATTAAFSADGDKDIAKNPVIKHFVGEWEAKGELTGQDGNVITIKEEWKGVVVSANTFAIEGKRVINNEESVYKWTITQNPDTGVYEAMHVINSGEAQRFEGNFSEPNFTVEWVAQLDGGSTIKLVESFTNEARDAFDTEVTFTNGKGETTLSGKVSNKKVK